MAEDFRFGISGSVQGVDLNRLLVTHQPSTYFMRVAEDDDKLDLTSGDVVVVDRALTPKPKQIVVVAELGHEQLIILPYSQISKEAELWGVVTYVIKKVA